MQLARTRADTNFSICVRCYKGFHRKNILIVLSLHFNIQNESVDS